MLDIFSGLRLVVKRRSISIDNAIFRCHWFFTSTLLVSFSLVITARQYVGQPIECHSVNKISESLLNSYCWVQSTFSVPQACNLEVGVEVPYPCIDNARGRDIKVFAYYQWVGMVLFIQGLLFHLPYYLWKVWENGLIRAITGGLRVAVLSDEEREKKKNIVVEYIHDHLGCHKRYALKYFLCEFICLVNLLLQLWATNKFFDGQFLRYGLQVIQYSSNQLSISSTPSPSSPFNTTSSTSQSADTFSQQPARSRHSSQARQHQVDPMTFIFPRITKCTYYDFGSSGDIQKHDALCLLPLNIINEKIYIALWFWFIVLALLTLLVIVYRLLAIASEQVRCKGLISRCKLSSERDIRIICRHCDVGDWFLFYMVAENLDPLVMREIVAAIASKICDHFELKRQLGVYGPGEQPESGGELDSCYKFGLPYGTESASLAGSRRSSLADGDGKLRKRLCSKRLWSLDLGPAEQRRLLFGQQPASNPDSGRHLAQAGGADSAGASASAHMMVSAPPISLMPLNSAAPTSSQLHLRGRRGSLSRGSSTGSSAASTATAADSFVMEMTSIKPANASARLEELSVSSGGLLQRRLSSSGAQGSANTRPPLLRQRSLNQGHAHHHSITSIRELLPESAGRPGVSGVATISGRVESA